MSHFPHLSRDLVLSYEGRNDFFASHPANIQRAMANDGENAPYVFNLLDVYRYQERYNDGYSYTNVFVGPNWLRDSAYVQDSDEVTQNLYLRYLEYIAGLRAEGKLQDMYMSEFAHWYVENIPIGCPQVYDAKEILYGSGKSYFWYSDPYMRVTVDLCQGGSIGDFRPLIAKKGAVYRSGPSGKGGRKQSLSDSLPVQEWKCLPLCRWSKDHFYAGAPGRKAGSG